MELGALVCTPRNPQCLICPVKKLCVAFKENRVEELPNLGKREAATARRFIAFVVEHNGKFLVRQRTSRSGERASVGISERRSRSAAL